MSVAAQKDEAVRVSPFQLARQREEELPALAAELNTRHAGLVGVDLIRAALEEEVINKVVLTSSFGAEAAVLLWMVAQVDKSLPVIFLDTGKLFPETLQYRDDLVERLGLTGVKNVHPVEKALQRQDPDGRLHETDTDTCCYIRKVLPLEQALEGFDAWITGRKRYQGGLRGDLPLFEAAGGRMKINPLVDMDKDDIQAFFDREDLPRHPLVEQGFTSIGCVPCTDAGGEFGDRSGRWAGQQKVECGIHLMDGGGI